VTSVRALVEFHVDDLFVSAYASSRTREAKVRQLPPFVRSLASSTDAMDAEWRRVRDALARRCEVIEEEAAVDAVQAAGAAGRRVIAEVDFIRAGRGGNRTGVVARRRRRPRRGASRRGAAGGRDAPARVGHRDANVGVCV